MLLQRIKNIAPPHQYAEDALSVHGQLSIGSQPRTRRHHLELAYVLPEHNRKRSWRRKFHASPPRSLARSSERINTPDLSFEHHFSILLAFRERIYCSNASTPRENYQ